MEQNCRRWSYEIVEAARRLSPAPVELQEHLSVCAACALRWREQHSLTHSLVEARGSAAQRNPSIASREALMRDFAVAHRRASYKWGKWVAAAAAVLALAVALGYEVARDRQPVRTSIAPKSLRPEASIAGFSGEYDPAEDEDFMAVPFAPPLATGEFVSVIRTELQAPALARMGIYVDASYGSDVPAEVVVGEDGVPRAIRFLGAAQF